MPKIGRNEFIREMKGKSIDVKEASNTALGKANIEKADLNHDGKISGDREMRKLFLQIDTFDHDGSYRSMNMSGAVKEMVEATQQLAQDKTTTLATPLQTNVVQLQLGRDIKFDVGERMKNAAEQLIKNHAHHYGVQDPWVNIDPHHALPANVRLGGLKGRWKCNLFAGNTMVQAGFEPPYYGNKGHGEYPNANQLYKWSDKYAAKYHNKTHFKMVDELDPSQAEDPYKAVEELLSHAKVGDMIIVDHPGDGVADGGHCRVLISKNPDGTWSCAQASQDAAIIREETLDSFVGEEHIWILRPNRPRTE